MEHKIYIWKMNRETKEHFIADKITINDFDVEKLALDGFKEGNNSIDEEKYHYRASIEETKH